MPWKTRKRGTRSQRGQRFKTKGKPSTLGTLAARARLASELMRKGTRKTKAKLKSIRILRAEGPTKECGKWRTFTNFADANRYLHENSSTAPKGGAYDKHHFVVEFTDGSVYKGRYDLHHGEYGDVKKHMLSFINYILSTKFDRHTYISKGEREEQRQEARKIKQLLTTVGKAKARVSIPKSLSGMIWHSSIGHYGGQFVDVPAEHWERFKSAFPSRMFPRRSRKKNVANTLVRAVKEPSGTSTVQRVLCNDFEW